MKKVIVVSKTHLDLGFTDYAENIRQKYIDKFIPEAIDLAEKVNKDGKKYFVWTTGSWILKEALAVPEKKARLEKAIREGNIAPHAMPFTTHTELLDEDSLDFGLSIVDDLDKLRGRKTVAAKMTDVPGHTKGLVPFLAKHGIKLLHIGVNGASALVDVPPCFLWKNGDSEVVVIYSGAYGGAFESDLVEEILYFDHTLDNHGAPSPEKVLAHFDDIQKEYPGYEITAGTIDDFADIEVNISWFQFAYSCWLCTWFCVSFTDIQFHCVTFFIDIHCAFPIVVVIFSYEIIFTFFYVEVSAASITTVRCC